MQIISRSVGESVVVDEQTSVTTVTVVEVDGDKVTLDITDTDGNVRQVTLRDLSSDEVTIGKTTIDVETIETEELAPVSC